MSQRMAVDDWRAMIDKTEAQSDVEPRSAEYWKARYEQNINDTKDIIEEYNKVYERYEELDKAWKEWRFIAERLQDDLRTGKRTCDFSFLGEDFVNVDNTTPAPAQSGAEPDRTYPGGRTKAEWDVIARASYERAKDIPDD